MTTKQLIKQLRARFSDASKHKWDTTPSFDEGWGLFHRDDGHLHVQVLDDPLMVRPDSCRCSKRMTNTPCRPCEDAGFTSRATDTTSFCNDEAAMLHVIERAQEGSTYHQEALLRIALWVKKLPTERTNQMNITTPPPSTAIQTNT